MASPVQPSSVSRPRTRFLDIGRPWKSDFLDGSDRCTLITAACICYCGGQHVRIISRNRILIE